MLNRRKFLKLASLGAGASAVAPGVLLSAEDKSKRKTRPNIVLIMVDDMGFSDLGCYGGEISTPNIDKLAQGGMRFTQFYNNAKCSPTRASLLSGLYSQQTGSGADVKIQHCATLAEVLKPAGYRTLMSGKWHAAEIPTQRGFDRHSGLADGCCNYFNPGKKRPGEARPGRKRKKPRRWVFENKVLKPYTPKSKKFYTTDAFTDYAINYLDAYKNEDKPFFLYLAYTAPHYPLHAWESDIKKYRNSYAKIGWDKLRKTRFANQLKQGLFPAGTVCSKPDPRTRDWNTLSNAEKDQQDLLMSVYAAMIDRIDQNVGKLVAKIRSLGQLGNTIFILLSDNGGTEEAPNRMPGVQAGPVGSYQCLGRDWANATNTPFRKYKKYDYEGGICTPFIVNWPGVTKPGAIVHEPVGHVIDIMPTLVEITGAKYPQKRAGQKVLPLEGQNLVEVFRTGKQRARKPIFFQFGRAKAVRDGKWKAVKQGNRPWELYDLKADRTELVNLAKKNPQKMRQLIQAWQKWARKCKLHYSG